MKDRQRISRNLVGSGTLPFVIMSDDDDEAQEGGALDTAIDYAGDIAIKYVCSRCSVSIPYIRRSPTRL